MKKNLLMLGFLCLVFSASNALLAASSQKMPVETATHFDKKPSERKSARQLKKADRWQKRLLKLEKKVQKKMEKQRKKGKTGGNFNLGFIGVVVLIVAGLFIALGLVIPAVGIVFLIIGIIIGFIGLLLLFLLGGFNVDVS